MRFLGICSLFLVVITLIGCTSNTAKPTFSKSSELRQEDISSLPRSEVERQLPEAHPSAYYSYAARLFGEGAKDEAVFWFYVGEIRYRFYLQANPSLPADGDPALFASLHEVVGSKINKWAGGDPDAWAKEMQHALDWDAANDNGVTSKTSHAEAWRETRSGLEKLEKYVLGNKAQILQQRKKNGL